MQIMYIKIKKCDQTLSKSKKIGGVKKSDEGGEREVRAIKFE